MLKSTEITHPALLPDSLKAAFAHSSRQPLGLVAGSGEFPLIVADKARSLGIPVVCLGVKNEASPDLVQRVDRFYWNGLAKLGHAIRCFKREGVRRVVMAGKIQKKTLYRPWRWLTLLPDWRMVRFYFFRPRRDNKDDSLLLGIIDEFAAEGIRFDSALEICPELLVNAGLLTRRKPSSSEEQDIAFGWELAKEMGRLDVGQSVAVRERAVLAVEAIEGTDQAILRAGKLCPSGNFVVIKVAKPQQDMRFDVPTIGCATIETMRKAGARVLAIEAAKTILIDQPQTVALADRYGITIIAR
jgi:UDP-2,3-diacylglucosamine hydrolase